MATGMVANSRPRTNRARTWRWRRMRRYGELSRGAEWSSPRQFFPDCTIAMRGYDFREGQLAIQPKHPSRVAQPANGGASDSQRPEWNLAVFLRSCVRHGVCDRGSELDQL